MIRAVSTQRHGRDHHHPAPAASAMRRGGRRLTRQRAAIWTVLTADPDAHLSAEEVARRVQLQLPAVNPSTVYRTLDVLVEDGFVLRTDLGGNRAYYEPAREHRHHHLVCESCGAVAHLHHEALSGLESRVLEASGFVVGDRELTLFGLCQSCSRR